MVSEVGRERLQRQRRGPRGVSDLDVTIRGAISIAHAAARSPGRAGEARSQEHRRGPVPARRVAARALKKSLDRGSRLLREPGGREPEHRLVSPAEPRLGHRACRLARKPSSSGAPQQGLFKLPRRSCWRCRASRSKTFEQAADFLRIPDRGERAGQHRRAPRALSAAWKSWPSGWASRCRGLLGAGVKLVKDATRAEGGRSGTFTFEDVVRELEKPGRDPREEFVAFQFREDIHEVAGSQAGMPSAPGIVTNVTNFGAFVDIGVHQDGLVHISQLADRFVKDPREVVNPGDRVSVRVLEVNLEKKQIALTMKSERTASAPRGDSSSRPPERRDADRRGPAPSNRTGGPSGARPPAPATRPFNNPFAALDKLRGK